MALDTVSDYLAVCRTLLQDVVVPYRYPDAELVVGLNMAMLDAWRLRYDMFIGLNNPPTYVSTQLSAPVEFPAGYRTALVYYVCGHVQLRDDEVNQDTRASAFLTRFQAQLLSLQ